MGDASGKPTSRPIASGSLPDTRREPRPAPHPALPRPHGTGQGRTHPDDGGTVERHTAPAGRSATRHIQPASPRSEAVEGTPHKPGGAADGSGADAPSRYGSVAPGARWRI